MNEKSTLRKVAKDYLTHTKTEKGITLVALVVTIVVLLILAGVSINLVLGNNGIIAKAKEAETKSAEASQNDLKGMNALTEEMNNALGEKPKVDLSKYKIGDLVNYTPNTEKSESTVNQSESGTSEQKVAKDATLKWRILNIDEAKGTVDLVSAAPTRSTVKFYGALGYHNGPYIMNKICEELYSNSTLNVKARNINLLDMEKHLTTPGITARNGYSSAVQYGATKTYTDNYSYYPLLYDGQKGAGVNVTAENASTIAQPNKDSGNDPYSESVETTSPLTDKTHKQADNKVLTVTQTYYNISINETNYGDAAKVLNNSTAYWVAARYVYSYSNLANFGLRFADTNTGGNGVFRSNGDSYLSGGCGLRPVVSLSSSILSETKDASGAWNLK